MKHSSFLLHTIAALVIAVSVMSCRKPSATGINKFADTVFIQIAQFQDQRLSDSLYKFLDHENPTYRRDAALAFASIQDSVAVDALSRLLLKDSDRAVRNAAAFAIGQTSCAASAHILAQAFESEKDPDVLSTILEGYGKATKKWALTNVATDVRLSAGLGWSFYRAGLNGSVDTTVNEKAVHFLSAVFPDSTRLAVAHFFGRAAKKFDPVRDGIFSAAQHDTVAEVRMAATLALRRITHDSARTVAQHILQTDKDYRVRVSATRVFQALPSEIAKPALLDALRDKNVQVRIAASEAMRGWTSKELGKEIEDYARLTAQWRVRANLCEIALAASGGEARLAREIKKLYDVADNVYQKAALLGGLQHAPTARDFIAEKISSKNPPVIRSSAATALVAMNYQQRHDPTVPEAFASIYANGMLTGDPAVIGIFSQALSDSLLGFKGVIRDFTFLYDAKKKLSLPKDYENLQPLEAAIAYFEGRKNDEAPKNPFTHPIDWALVKHIPRDQKALVKTTRGDIVLRFFVEEAPGSVANFISLVQQKYFDHKIFHRVVPNFVIQVGCPRGDGYGNEDYAIRSEFSERRYTTGSVGMASAGKDTEGVQWFITHSPTPHLDGKYSIFAEVVSGMDVVHQMEIGDEILGVELVPALNR
jgi:cyclophilin family peptidyl-prolyl cis-trans isomerase/HEAT repeat protein